MDNGHTTGAGLGYEKAYPQKPQGLFIVFEGGEGSGKSTQTYLLGLALSRMDIPHVTTREPGGTTIGMKLRSMILDRGEDALHAKTELLLFAADRAEHVETTIRPTLERGYMVISDRYCASTMAYQGYGRNGNLDEIKMINDYASGGLKPDITFLLDMAADDGLIRSIEGGNGNRFEDMDLAFHRRVENGFHAQVDESWVKMNATLPVEVVHENVLRYVLQKYRERMGGLVLAKDCPYCHPIVGDAKAEDFEKAITFMSTPPLKRDPSRVPNTAKEAPYRCPQCDVVLTDSLFCPERHGWLRYDPDGTHMWMPMAKDFCAACQAGVTHDCNGTFISSDNHAVIPNVSFDCPQCHARLTQFIDNSNHYYCPNGHGVMVYTPSARES